MAPRVTLGGGVGGCEREQAEAFGGDAVLPGQRAEGLDVEDGAVAVPGDAPGCAEVAVGEQRAGATAAAGGRGTGRRSGMNCASMGGATLFATWVDQASILLISPISANPMPGLHVFNCPQSWAYLWIIRMRFITRGI
jgi:hypothetical protein